MNTADWTMWNCRFSWKDNSKKKMMFQVPENEVTDTTSESCLLWRLKYFCAFGASSKRYRSAELATFITFENAKTAFMLAFLTRRAFKTSIRVVGRKNKKMSKRWGVQGPLVCNEAAKRTRPRGEVRNKFLSFSAHSPLEKWLDFRARGKWNFINMIMLPTSVKQARDVPQSKWVDFSFANIFWRLKIVIWWTFWKSTKWFCNVFRFKFFVFTSRACFWSFTLKFVRSLSRYNKALSLSQQLVRQNPALQALMEVKKKLLTKSSNFKF